MTRAREFAEPPLAGAAEIALRDLQALAGATGLAPLSAVQLIGERAKLTGLTYAPGRSAGGSCRLLAAADATVAVNLPRLSDWELIPAWLETDDTAAQGWGQLAAHIHRKRALPLVERSRLLGIAAAPADAAPPPEIWCLPATPLPTATRQLPAPRVVDLSGLWAGPLCGHLLALCGADVIKVESTPRPDGARLGDAGFFNLLNQHKRCVALDLSQTPGQRLLAKLLQQADIIIEAARPRALEQMGIHAQRLLETRPNLTWVSITGYGRDDPGAQWIAFGDDAGVAAGLSAVMRDATGDYQFAGDAIADPVTGIYAALGAWRSWLAGGSRLISLPLAHVAAAALQTEIDRDGPSQVSRRFGRWWRQANSSDPHPGIHQRQAGVPARSLGADTATVLAELGVAC